jgi:hypothetical protein
MATRQKLELTWIGKDQRPRLEPRILLEDPARSYQNDGVQKGIGVRSPTLHSHLISASLPKWSDPSESSSQAPSIT